MVAQLHGMSTRPDPKLPNPYGSGEQTATIVKSLMVSFSVVVLNEIMNSTCSMI